MILRNKIAEVFTKDNYAKLETLLKGNIYYKEKIMAINFSNGTWHEINNNEINSKKDTIIKTFNDMTKYILKLNDNISNIFNSAIYIYLGDNYPRELEGLPLFCLSKLQNQNAILLPLWYDNSTMQITNIINNVTIITNPTKVNVLQELYDLLIKEIKNKYYAYKYIVNLDYSCRKYSSDEVVINLFPGTETQVTFFDEKFIKDIDYIEIKYNSNVDKIVKDILDILTKLENNKILYNKLLESSKSKLIHITPSLVSRSIYSLLLNTTLFSNSLKNEYSNNSGEYSMNSTALVSLIKQTIENRNGFKYSKDLNKFLNKNMKWDKLLIGRRLFQLSQCKNDGEIYDYLIQFNATQENIYKSYKPKINNWPASENNKPTKRENYRAHEIYTILKDNRIDLRGGKYLDYGANGCLITGAVGEILKMTPWACDIPNWSGKQNSCIDVGIPYGDLENGKIPSGNGFPETFNLITVLMVLHHIPKSELEKSIINIINRINVGGYLLVREHDVRDKFTENICDIEHAIYDIVKDKMMQEDFANSYITNYNSIPYWINLIEGFGMKLLYKTIPVTLGKYTYILFIKNK